MTYAIELNKREEHLDWHRSLPSALDLSFKEDAQKPNLVNVCVVEAFLPQFKVCHLMQTAVDDLLEQVIVNEQVGGNVHLERGLAHLEHVSELH